MHRNLVTNIRVAGKLNSAEERTSQLEDKSASSREDVRENAKEETQITSDFHSRDRLGTRAEKAFLKINDRIFQC